MNDYRGTIVEESLKDNRIINNLEVINLRIGEELSWHLVTVKISPEQIKDFSQYLKPKWYAHFWKGSDIYAVFENKVFHFNYDDKSTWKPAVDYGLSVGIPAEQLEFLLE